MGFSANSLGRLNVEIGYTVDTSGLNQIQQSLNLLMTNAQGVSNKITAGMAEAGRAAQQFGSILGSSINAATGQLDMARLATNMKSAGVTLGGLQTQFSKAGAAGQAAFSNINTQLMSTQQTVTKAEGAIAQIGKTFANTFMYSFSYRIVGSFIKGVSNAISYVKDLDKSLTSIRIVTKESAEEMEQFAQKANKAAKNLGVSTKAYTDASLIFTQQGLKGKERDIKTETTMKVANVTGDDAAEVSQNLTAVWNGYKVASEQAEAAIDKLANVAAHSASNLAELSTGMSKVASAANSMGVSEDQLVAQLSTIESVTRQAPESIGTALKTIYARMGDLQVDGADEFGVSLGEVSNKLKTMGIDILDQEGNMKEMGQVMEEVAGKWDTWTQAQQQAAAVAMAGKRQYNNLISLFSNWDMYEQNIDYSKNSEGEIEAQQQIYLESIEGLQAKAKASWEAVYSETFDSDLLKGFYEMIAGIGDAFSNMGDWLPVAEIALIGTLFQKYIVDGLTKVTLGLTQHQAQLNAIKLQEDAIAISQERTLYLSNNQLITENEIVNTGRQLLGWKNNEGAVTAQQIAKETELDQRVRDRLNVHKNVKQMREEEAATQNRSLAFEAGKWSLETKRVNTNREIMSYAFGQQSAQKGMNAELIIAQRAESTIGKLKGATAGIMQYLTTEEQENLNLLIAQTTEQEKKMAEYSMEASQLANLLGMSEKEVEAILEKSNGEEQLVNEVTLRAEKLGEVSAITDNINTKDLENLSAKDRRIKIEQILQEMLGVENNEMAKSVELTNAQGEKVTVTNDAYQIFMRLVKQTGVDLGVVSEKITQGATATDELQNKFNFTKNIIDQNTGSISRFISKGSQIGAVSGKFQGFTSTIFGLGMAFSSIKSTMDTINDPDTSGFEKVVSVMMSVGMVMMSVTQTANGLRTMFSTVPKAIEGVTLSTKALSMAQTDEQKNSLNSIATKQMQGLIDEEAAEKKYIKVLANDAEATSEQEAMGVTIAHGVATKDKAMIDEIETTSIWKKIGAILMEKAARLGLIGVILLAAAVIGVILVTAYATATTKQQEHTEALKEAQAEAHKASEVLTDVKDKYDELNKSLSDLKTGYSTLETLTKGTEEWNEKLLEINTSVTELIEKYPQLAEGLYVDEDGVFKIDAGVQAGFQENMKKQLQEAQADVLNAQANIKMKKVVVTADDMSDIVETDPSSKFGDEYSKEMMSVIKDSNIQTVGQLKSTLESKLDTKLSDNQASKLFSYLQQARNDDKQKINLLKQSAKTDKDAKGFDFQGYGKTEEEREENAEAKENLYASYYAQGKEIIEKNKEKRDSDREDADAFGFEWTEFDWDQEGYWGKNSDDAITREEGGVDNVIDYDDSDEGENDLDDDVQTFDEHMKNMMPTYLKPFITEDFLKNDLGFKESTDLDIIHWAAKDLGVSEDDLEWKQGTGVVWKKEAGNDNAEAVSEKYKFKDRAGAANMVEDRTYEEVFTTALKKFLKTDVNINSDIQTGALKTISNTVDTQEKENGNIVVANANIHDYKAGETNDVQQEVDKLNKELEKKDLSEEERKALEQRRDYYKGFVDDEQKISKEVKERIGKTEKEAQDIFYQTEKVKGKDGKEYNRYLNRFSVADTETASQLIKTGRQQTESENAKLKSKGKEETNENEIAKLYKKATLQKDEEGNYSVDPTDVTDALKSIDWDKINNTDDLKANFESLGIKTDDLKLNWEDLIEEGKNLVNVSTDVAANFEKISAGANTFLGIIRDLKPGQSISDKDYQEIIANAADPEAVAKSFSYDAVKKRYIYNGLDQFGKPDSSKAGIKEAMVTDPEEALEASQKLKQSFAGGNINSEDKKNTKTNLSDYDLQGLEGNKRHSTYKENVSDLIKNAEATKGEEGEQLQQDLKHINNTDYTDLYEAINNGAFVKKDGKMQWKDSATRNLWQDKYNQYLKDLRNTQTGLQNGAFDPDSAETLSSTLQMSSGGVSEILNKADAFSKTLGTDKKKKYEGTMQALSSEAASAAEALGGTAEEEAAFTEQIAQNNPLLQKNTDEMRLFKQVAGSVSYNLVKGVEKISSLLNDTYKDVKAGTPQYAQMLSEVATAASKAFGMDVDTKFVNKHLAQFKRMANGDKKAIKELQRELVKTKTLGKNLKAKIKVDKKGGMSEFNSLMKQMQDKNVKVGVELKEEKFVKAIFALFKRVGAKAKDLTDFFADMDYSIKIKYKKGKGKGDVKGDESLENIEIDTVKKETNFDDLDFASASEDGKGDSDSGGSGSNDAPQKQFEAIDKKDIDRLHDLKEALEDLNHTLEKLQKNEDRVFGQGLIDNLKEQNKQLEKKNQNLKKQINIETKELGHMQTDMKKLFGSEFTKKGRIKNYSKVYNKLYKRYYKEAKAFNNMSPGKQEGAAGEKQKAKMTKAKSYLDEYKTFVSDYDNKYNDRQEKLNELVENFNKISDNNLKKLHAMSEAIEKTNELQQVYLDFQKDVLHSEKDRGYAAEYNVQTSKLTLKQLQADKTELEKLNKKMAKLKKKGWSKEDGVNFKGVLEATSNAAKKYAEDVKKVQQSLIDTIKLSGQAWKDYAEDIENVNKKYSALLDTLKSYEEITKLLFGDDEYSTFINIDKEQVEVYKSQLYTYSQERRKAEDRLAKAQKAYDENKDEKLKDSLETDLREAEQAVRDANKNILSTVTNLLTAYKSIYTNTVKQGLQEYNNALTSNYGWETISNTLKKDKQYSDDWLDASQKIGNIASLTANFEQEIAKASNYSASAQQKILQCRQEQLSLLEKIDKLTQYDIDRAKAKMSLLLKEIALEEARENKSKLRLKRDSQGNYSYQYSGDKEAVAKAQEDLENERLKMADDAQKQYMDSLSQIQQAEQEFGESQEKLAEKLAEAINKKDQSEANRIKKEMEANQASYERQITPLYAKRDRYKNYNESDHLYYFNKQNGTKYSSVDKAKRYDGKAFDEYMYGAEGIVPSSELGDKAMNRSLTEALSTSHDYTKSIITAAKTYSNSVAAVADKAGGSLKSIIQGTGASNGLVDVQNESKKLRAETDKVTSSYEKQEKAIDKCIKKLKEYYAQADTKAAEKTLKQSKENANNFEKTKANVKAMMNFVNKHAQQVIDAFKKMSNAGSIAKMNIEGAFNAAMINAKGKGKGSSGNGGSGNGGSNGNRNSGGSNIQGDYNNDGTIGPGEPGFSYGKKKTFKGRDGKTYSYYKGSDDRYYTADKKKSFSTKKKLKEYVQPYNPKKIKKGTSVQTSITKKKNSSTYKVKIKANGHTITRTAKSLKGAKTIAKNAKKTFKKRGKITFKSDPTEQTVKTTNKQGKKFKVKVREVDGNWQYYNKDTDEWISTNYTKKKNAAQQGANDMTYGKNEKVDKWITKNGIKVHVRSVSYGGKYTWRYYNPETGMWEGKADGISNYKTAESAATYGSKAIKKARKPVKAKRSAKSTISGIYHSPPGKTGKKKKKKKKNTYWVNDLKGGSKGKKTFGKGKKKHTVWQFWNSLDNWDSRNNKWYQNKQVLGNGYEKPKQAYSAWERAMFGSTLSSGSYGKKGKIESNTADKGKKITKVKKWPKSGIELFTTWDVGGDWNPLRTKGKHVAANNLVGAKITKVKNRGIGVPDMVQLSGKKIGKRWARSREIEKYFKGTFATGGYTGTWNDKAGRWALLHQKEIVLNKQDTVNFLQAVKLTRQFAQDLSKYKTGLVDKVTSIANNNKMINTNTSTRHQATQQQINIKASFPNATNSSEIEKAFQQLSAKATQYAWSNKIK